MAFGLQPSVMKKKYTAIFRNWITLLLREQIMLEERKAYKAKRPLLIQNFFSKFDDTTKEELTRKKLLYDVQGLSAKFEKIVT